jgi:hypothetical protein
MKSWLWTVRDFFLADDFSCILEEECKDGKGDGDGDEVGG